MPKLFLFLRLYCLPSNKYLTQTLHEECKYIGHTVVEAEQPTGMAEASTEHLIENFSMHSDPMVGTA